MKPLPSPLACEDTPPSSRNRTQDAAASPEHSPCPATLAAASPVLALKPISLHFAALIAKLDVPTDLERH